MGPDGGILNEIEARADLDLWTFGYKVTGLFDTVSTKTAKTMQAGIRGEVVKLKDQRAAIKEIVGCL